MCFVAPVFNAAHSLPQTLISIRETASSQSEREIPIYLLDGGSKDGTRFCAYDISKKYRNIYFIDKEGTHPGDRMNWFIENSEEDIAMIFHADDFYCTEARASAAIDMHRKGAIASGTQCNYLQSPLDSAKGMTTPYSGSHHTYPLEKEAIYQSLNFWWAVSLNTLSFDIKRVRSSGIRYDYQAYKYCADYMFNYQLAASHALINSPLVSTLTIHATSSDGYSNIVEVFKEAQAIRRKIRCQTGFSAILGSEHEAIMDTLCYDQGGFSAVLNIYKHSSADYLRLAARIYDISRQSSDFSLIAPYAKAIAEMAIKLI